MCLRCRPVGHGVSHDTDMGRHPLKVNAVSLGGEAEEEVVDGEGEAVVGVGAEGVNKLEGSEGISKEGNGARGSKGGGKIKALFDGEEFRREDGGSGRQPPGSGKGPGGNKQSSTNGWRAGNAGAVGVYVEVVAVMGGEEAVK